MSGLKARIASAEARARILSPGLRIVTIEGGLRDGVADVAEYGDEIIHRREGESVELFRARAVEEATVFGARLVVLGGLPDMPMTSAMRDVLVPHSQWGR